MIPHGIESYFKTYFTNNLMYNLNNYEQAEHLVFKLKLSVLMELAGKVSPEEAIKESRPELKNVKRIRKSEDKDL